VCARRGRRKEQGKARVEMKRKTKENDKTKRKGFSQLSHTHVPQTKRDKIKEIEALFLAVYNLSQPGIYTKYIT
jgi:hypothetical protein